MYGTPAVPSSTPGKQHCGFTLKPCVYNITHLSTETHCSSTSTNLKLQGLSLYKILKQNKSLMEFYF